MMRAKLTISEVTQRIGGDSVKFTADYSGSKEDNSFSAATPTANLEMFISNPALIGTFKPGQRFYVDFTPVDTSAPATK